MINKHRNSDRYTPNGKGATKRLLTPGITIQWLISRIQNATTSHTWKWIEKKLWITTTAAAAATTTTSLVICQWRARLMCSLPSALQWMHKSSIPRAKKISCKLIYSMYAKIINHCCAFFYDLIVICWGFFSLFVFQTNELQHNFGVQFREVWIWNWWTTVLKNFRKCWAKIFRLISKLFKLLQGLVATALGQNNSKLDFIERRIPRQEFEIEKIFSLFSISKNKNSFPNHKTEIKSSVKWTEKD